MEYLRKNCDVLVVGGGIAACFAAIKACQAGARVILADKGYAGRSGQSPYADSFMAFDPEDEAMIQSKLTEINRISEYVNNRYWTETCLRQSRQHYQELVDWGCRFHPLDNAMQFDKSAEAYGEVLRRQVLRHGAEIVDRVMIAELLKQDGRIVGAVGLPNESLDLIIFQAKTVILCVGGCGYKPEGYPPLMQMTCDGEAMAYRAGAEIVGKEFVDLHFTKEGKADPVGQRMAPPPPPKPKGGGEKPGRGGPGFRVNAQGEVISDRPEGCADYMFTYLQSEFEVHAGRGPVTNNGIPVIGGAALGMSLRKADGLWPAGKDCRSSLPGLYAAGDAMGTMQNGAAYNTQGSSIANGAVTGSIAGQAAAREAKGLPVISLEEAEVERAVRFVLALLERGGGFSPAWVTQLLKNTMIPYYVFYIQKEDRLQAALTFVEFMERQLVPKLYAGDSHSLRLAHETANMVLNAEMRLRSGLFRTESRGNHYREDYPFRDDENWLAWVKIKNNGGRMELEKVPIPEEWKPDPALSYGERYPFPFPGEEGRRQEPWRFKG